MAVREFTDAQGVVWHTWCVTPDHLYPQTRAEDLQSEYFELGWMVFQTRDGLTKRRLCPFPTDWMSRSDTDLAELLQNAEAVMAPTVQEAPQPISTEATAVERRTGETRRKGLADLTDDPLVGSFRYPGGRLWTVCVVPYPLGGGGPVLRFQAGTRVFDLPDWPRDWADYTESQLVGLLRLAAPRRDSAPDADTPKRRHDDIRAARVSPPGIRATDR